MAEKEKDMHSTEQLHKDKAKQSQSDAAKAEKKDQPKKEDPLKKKDAEIDELKKKNSDLEDKFLRAEAEMQNMTKRFQKEQAQLLKYEGKDLAKAILPVVDNLGRALKSEAEDKASQQLKHGIEMVAKDLDKALNDNDIHKMDALNKPFDPVYHQAVKTVPAEKDEQKDTVIEVYQDGYMLKDRVLRPAMVVVAQ